MSVCMANWYYFLVHQFLHALEIIKMNKGTSKDYAIVLVICIITVFITQLTSNVVTANIHLPGVSKLAKSIGTNPLFLMIPATITCSYAFMPPVAMPPNAAVYSASGMNTSEIILDGSVFNVICICVNIIPVNTYDVYIFNLH